MSMDFELVHIDTGPLPRQSGCIRFTNVLFAIGMRHRRYPTCKNPPFLWEESESGIQYSSHVAAASAGGLRLALNSS